MKTRTEIMREYRENNREKTNEIAARYREKHREELIERGRKARKDPEKNKKILEHGRKSWQKNGKQRPGYYKNSYSNWVCYKWKMTKEQYEAFIINGCNICGSFERLCVDHNHETNEIRGCLCHNCNVAIGHLRDDINLLETAIEYLKKEQGSIEYYL
jgi:hypothetical protein